MSARGLPVVVVALALGAAGAARAGEAAPDCARPLADRPPDPRCGETLDGRGPAQTTSGARQVGRLVLWIPRAISAGLTWPLVESTEVIETHHVPDRIDAWLTSDDGKVGVRPLVAYATGFLPTVGLRFFYRRLPGVGSGVSATFETAGPSVLMGALTGVAPIGTGLTFSAVANRRDDRYFAGIGPLTKQDLAANGWGFSRYGSDIFSAGARWSRRLPAHFGVSVHSDVEKRVYRADPVRGGASIANVFRTPSAACDATTAPLDACVDPALVPGFQAGLQIVHAGTGFTWDGRSHERDGSGASLAVDATVARGIAGDPSRQVTFTAEPTFALGSIDRQLLVHGRAAMIDAIGDAPISFDELVMMAGSGGMRGFPDGRFRGESGLVGTAEYRWYVAHNLDASIFTDLGTVAGHDFAGLRSAHWFPSYGVGLRLYQTPSTYWEGTVMSSVQFVYAPDNGFRITFAVATF